MYANLRVVIPASHVSREEEVICHAVEIDPFLNKVVLHLDDPADESKYAVPQGEREVPLSSLGARKLIVKANW